MQTRVRAEKPPVSESVPGSVTTSPDTDAAVLRHRSAPKLSPLRLEPRGWLRRRIDSLRGQGRVTAEPSDVADPLLAFTAETAPSRSTSTGATSGLPRATSRSVIVPVVVAVLVGIAGVGSVAVGRMALVRVSAPELSPGVLTVETQPPGATVIIDGTVRGVTPVTLSLNPGAHSMMVGSNGDERVVPVNIAPGAQVSQYFELKQLEPIARTGLAIASDPPGARISIDGQPRGNAPLTISDLRSGEYRVTATSESGSTERTVRVEEGAVASLVFALPRIGAALGGWISVKAPFNVDVLENAQVIGTGDIAKMMLPAGRHDIVLVNRALDYREARRIDVAAGSTTEVRIDPPVATVSANARPWADVTIDGKSVGQTPISNLQVPIGVHEVVFRHPRLGERRQTVTVTMNGPNRFAADMAN